MRKYLSILFFIVVMSLSPLAQAAEDIRIYLKARQFARSQSYDFAFMQYRSLLRQYPGSPYTKEALFAQGEYFFLIPDYDKAAEVFRQFVEQYPEDEGKLFALAYLLKIARIQGAQEAVEQYTRDIATFKQLSLVFRDFKEYRYLSPLERQHRAVFQIDTIAFFIKGEPFAKLSY
jgi:outer membrane protein assembly factor BamD (BamD/ComL family)